MITPKIANNALDDLENYVYKTDKLTITYNDFYGTQETSFDYEFETIKRTENKIICKGPEIKVIFDDSVWIEKISFYSGKELWLEENVREGLDEFTFTGKLTLSIEWD